MPTPTDLAQWVEQRVDADETISTEAGLLVLAAVSGDVELDDYLEKRTDPRREPETSAATDETPATGAFLRTVTVSGFRGIGAPVTLDLRPTPGLTVVAGRNGSGKSSLAEAVELLLTGGTYRWKNKRSTQWADQWRNLHHGDQPEISAVVVEEGSGPIRLRTLWEAATTDVRSHTTTAQRTTDGTLGPLQSSSTLGWAGALDTFRPMLSYDELGGLLEAGPSELYDALAKVLGTEQLSDALARLKSRRDSLGAPGKTVTAERKVLQGQAAGLPEDERARAMAALLRKTSPDVAAVRELATGVAQTDAGLVAALRALTHLATPDPDRVSTAANRLREAKAAMAEAGEDVAARRVARLDVRRSALTLHTDHGDQSCPVCGQSTLDNAWAEGARALVRHEEEELRLLTDAHAELLSARSAARGLVARAPAPLDRAPHPALESVVDEARRVWNSWQTVPDDDLEAADHLELWADELARVAAAARAQAAQALQERDDAWAPIAARISAWCGAWEQWIADKPRVDDLTSAHAWLQANDIALKNELMSPISERAKRAWSLLKQDSNVELGDLRLEGQANRRRVTISASIDGEDAGGALPVMSQGELHALALALFLPRASLDESPFRFIVLDDPVQAMDPAKIDGLVTLLTELAETRQVIVFSHDDRLPAALRRIGSAARIVEVTRGLKSAVQVMPAEDPTQRYLRDAHALTKDTGLPDATLRRTLPGLLRMAIEAAARDRFFATRLTRGEPLADVEDSWASAPKTAARVSLAVYDEVRSLDTWLTTEARKKGLGIATSGFHQGLGSQTNPADAVRHARKLVEDVRAGTK